MNKNLTEIAFILDRSGSMASVTEAAITGFNEFLRDQQKVEGQARLTLVLFGDSRTGQSHATAERVSPISYNQSPNECTARISRRFD